MTAPPRLDQTSTNTLPVGAVPQLFCVLIYTVPRDVFGTEATRVELPEARDHSDRILVGRNLLL